MKINAILIFLTLYFGLALSAVAQDNTTQQALQALQKEFPDHKFNPRDIAVGDFNKDGIDDLAAFIGASHQKVIVIFLGRKDGSYKLLGKSSEYVAEGDLNNDGLDDLAAFVGDSYGYSTTENDNALRIAVFFGQKDGSYRLFAVSGDTYRHERATQYLGIEKQSLYLSRNGLYAGDRAWSEDFHFKVYAGELVLTSMESKDFVIIGDMEPDDHGKNINYMTNEVIYWRTTGGKHKEIKKKFPAVEYIKLRSFDYTGYNDSLPIELNGYIDENFNFNQ
jgi:hypothetical protein